MKQDYEQRVDDIIKMVLKHIKNEVDEKIPSERELSPKIEVSRTELRGCYAILKYLGYVKTGQGAKTKIIEPIKFPLKVIR